MDAGVPIKSRRSRYRYGSGEEGDNHVVPSDILGLILKITRAIWTSKWRVPATVSSALQMDIKIEGINKEIMQVALNRAKGARLHILEVMEQAINESRGDILNLRRVIHTIKISARQDQRRDG